MAKKIASLKIAVDDRFPWWDKMILTVKPQQVVSCYQCEPGGEFLKPSPQAVLCKGHTGRRCQVSKTFKKLDEEILFSLMKAIW